MEIFDDLSKIVKNDNTTLTIGTFDGVHLGHRKILETVKQKALLHGGRSLIITFNPHPKTVVSSNYDIKILTGLDEKLQLFEQLDVENVLIINFSKEFSRLSSEDFFKQYIIDQVGLREIVIGHDHHFGRNRTGNEKTLLELSKSYAFNVTAVEAFEINGEGVSSTKIRNALQRGDVKTANMYLGRPYSFKGVVVKGDKRGRALGFPTANIKPDNHQKLLPYLGIYAVEAKVRNSKFLGLLSVGKRPTFYQSGDVVPEVYIYDFDEDIYDEEITVSLIERIRGEEKYSSAEELVVQMNKDKEAGLEIFNRRYTSAD